MELVKNKASGKYFIVLDDMGDTGFLVITPEGRVKNLESRLFGPPLSVDSMDSQWNMRLTKEQVELYAEFYDEEGI